MLSNAITRPSVVLGEGGRAPSRRRQGGQVVDVVERRPGVEVGDWQQAGTDRNTVIREFLRWYVGEGELPARPEPPERSM